MSNRKLNSYDVLMWWGKVLNSCNTEEQFKNALNLWPKVIELTPCVDDAWLEVVEAARRKLSRIANLPRVKKFNPCGYFVFQRIYPNTALEIKRAVFGFEQPPVTP